MNTLTEFARLTGLNQSDFTLGADNPFRASARKGKTGIACYQSVPLRSEGRLVPVRAAWTREEHGRRCFRGVSMTAAADERAVLLRAPAGTAELSFDEDVTLEPTMNGVAASHGGPALHMTVTLDRPRNVRHNEMCAAFLQEEFIPFLTVSGIVGERGPRCRPLALSVKALPPSSPPWGGTSATQDTVPEASSNGSNRFLVTAVGDAGCDRLLLEINVQTHKLLFDTTVQEKLPDVNNCFGGTVFLGQSERFGEQRLYARFDTALLRDLNRYRVHRADLYLPRYGGPGGLVCARMAAPWCSFGTTWNNRIPPVEPLYVSERCGDYERLEVSEIVRDLLQRNEPADPGFVLSAVQGCTAISTGDSCYRPQIFIIHYHL